MNMRLSFAERLVKESTSKDKKAVVKDFTSQKKYQLKIKEEKGEYVQFKKQHN